MITFDNLGNLGKIYLAHANYRTPNKLSLNLLMVFKGIKMSCTPQECKKPFHFRTFEAKMGDIFHKSFCKIHAVG